MPMRRDIGFFKNRVRCTKRATCFTIRSASGSWSPRRNAIEPTDEADRGRHPGFARYEGLRGGPGSLSLSFGGGESMRVLIRYQRHDEAAPRELEVSPEEYFDPLDPGEELSVRSIPRLNDAYQYTP